MTQPIPNPTMTAETNSLPARKPSDIADPTPSGLASRLGSGAGDARGPTFKLA